MLNNLSPVEIRSAHSLESKESRPVSVHNVSSPTEINDLQPHQSVVLVPNAHSKVDSVNPEAPSHSPESVGRETCVPSPSSCELAITGRIDYIDEEAQTPLAGAEADSEVVDSCFALSTGQLSKLHHGNLVSIEKQFRNNTHSVFSIEKKSDRSVSLEDTISPTPSPNFPDSADIKETFRRSAISTSSSAMPLSYQPAPISSPLTQCSSIPAGQTPCYSPSTLCSSKPIELTPSRSPPTQCASIPTEHTSHSSQPTLSKVQTKPREFFTPASIRVPKKKPKSRFIPIYSPHGREPVEDYRPGGYHPVHLGEFLYNQRYEISRKLGYGAASTVWLARDLWSSSYVSIKIKTAKSSTDQSELSILNDLNRNDFPVERSRHIVTLLNSFQHHGPNGKHTCLVFETLGPSLSTMLDWTPEYRGRTPMGSKCYRFPLWMAKRISKDVLLGISYLHSQGITHGDIHFGNVLFVAPKLSFTDELECSETETNMALRRSDGKLDTSAPRYIPITRPLLEYANRGPDLSVKLSDLGSAFKLDGPSRHPKTAGPLRAPEQILHASLDQSIDVWSLGCLVYELITGTTVFPSVSMGSKDKADDTHLLDMIDRLGPLPEHLFSAWPRSHYYFRPNGKLFNSMVGSKRHEEIILPSESIETVFEQEKPTELDDEEGAIVLNLLRQVFRYEPEKRPSANDVLNHPWFKMYVS